MAALIDSDLITYLKGGNENVCRGCTQNIDNEIEVYSMHWKIRHTTEKNDTYEANIKDIFQCLTSIIIESDDDLPVCFCGRCYRFLLQFFLFRMQCINSDIKLKARTNVNKSDSTVNISDMNISIDSKQVDDILTDLNIDKDVGNNFDSFFDEQNNLSDIYPSAKHEIKNNSLIVVESPNVISSRENDSKMSPSKASMTKSQLNTKENNCNQDYMCTICRKVLKNKVTLRRHQIRHSTNKKINCPRCDFQCHLKCDLSKHMVTHKLVSRHMCDLCGSTFSRKDSLKIHYKIHDGIKPHACPYCEKRFLNPTNLGNHMRIHLQHRPFICDYCSKDFTQKVNLVIHIKTHMKNNGRTKDR